MRHQRSHQTKTAEATHHKTAVASTKPPLPTRAPLHPILQLQRLIGNRAVSQLIQAKLKVSQSGDVFEQEADRIADAVMRMPEPSVQRQVEPEEEDEKMVQRQAISNQITPLVQRQGLPKMAAVRISVEDVIPKNFVPYGGFHWGINWRTNARNGFIVQKIHQNFSVRNCVTGNLDTSRFRFTPFVTS